MRNLNKPYLAVLFLIFAALACNLPDAAATAPVSLDTSPELEPSPTVIELPAPTATPSGPLPDLVVTITAIDSPTIVLAQEPWTWVHYEVTNIGEAATPEEIRLLDTLNGEATSGYLSVDGPLQPQQSVAGQFAVGHQDHWQTGSYELVIIVDYWDAIFESNEDNNASQSLQFEVVAP